jgi:hypothetical protein
VCAVLSVLCVLSVCCVCCAVLWVLCVLCCVYCVLYVYCMCTVRVLYPLMYLQLPLYMRVHCACDGVHKIPSNK